MSSLLSTIHYQGVVRFFALAVIVAISGFSIWSINEGSANQTCKICDVPEQEWANLPQDKQEVMERLQASYEAALQQPAPAKDGSSRKAREAVPVESEPAKALPEGIFETSQAPLPKTYQVQNQWQGVLGEQLIQVYAGTLTSNQSNGIVVVLTTSPDRINRGLEEFATPADTGSLRIIDVDENVLTLVSKDGTYWRFDVIRETFSTIASLPQWPEGIFSFGQAAFPAGQPFADGVFDIKNVWQGVSGNDYVRIFAGSYLADPQQGVVIHQRVPQSLQDDGQSPNRKESIALSSTKDGALEISGINGEKLELESSAGRAFEFDITSNSLSSK